MPRVLLQPRERCVRRGRVAPLPYCLHALDLLLLEGRVDAEELDRLLLLELLRENGVEDVVVVVGGTIPDDDADELRKLGVAGVFGPGAPTTEIVDFIRGAVPA